MELSNMVIHLLENLDRPAFVACDGKVVHANQKAQIQHIQADMPLADLLQEQLSQLEAFQEGQLQVTLQIEALQYQASVQKIDGLDLFIVENPDHSAPLKALALASQQLRIPLTNLMAVMDETNPTANRAVYQLHRVISNMSDALRYRIYRQPKLQLVDAAALVDSIMESVIARQEQMNTTIQYTGLSSTLFCMMDEELLERAILNLISNSVKAQGSHIQVTLSQKNNSLMLSVTDNGRGIRNHGNSKVFTYFDREPSIDHCDYGLGLGMLMVQAAAVAHKGTVFMEHMKDGGLRITMTMSIITADQSVRAPAFRIDYLGGRDHVLTELSDVLNDSEY